MNRTPRLIVRTLTLAALATAVPMATALAAIFDVTTTADGNDGACDAHCTLREAIVAANVDRNRDVINLPPGAYRLSIPGRGENRAATGDLDILERIDLRGAAEETTIIDGGGLDRVLHIHHMDWWHGDEPVKITDVTITGGEVQSPGAGGGILIEDALSLEHCSIESNLARGFEATGGGIANAGTLALKNVTISDNITDGDHGAGGGIWNSHGTLSIVDSVISNNSTYGDGADGAGLHSRYGTGTLLRVTISGNDGAGALSDGGGIWAGYSTFSIVSCTINDNAAAGVRGGGGIWIGSSTVAVVNSTISGNVATNGGAGAGGIWTDGSTLTLASCTFTGNSVIGGGTQGGALWKGRGTVVVTNTLIDGGYAKVTVTAGSGVVAYGSVIDNGTGDATTMPMWRSCTPSQLAVVFVHRCILPACTSLSQNTASIHRSRSAGRKAPRHPRYVTPIVAGYTSPKYS